MALSSGFDSNLALTLLGSSITAGLAYGGYVVFKEKQQPATQLLQMRKKTVLDKEGDVELWKASWKKYLEKHTKVLPPEQETAPASPAPKSPIKAKPTTPKPNTKIDDKDMWELQDWTDRSKKANEVPDSFKDACENKSSEKYLGTWDKKYQEFEEFCAKEAEKE